MRFTHPLPAAPLFAVLSVLVACSGAEPTPKCPEGTPITPPLAASASASASAAALPANLGTPRDDEGMWLFNAFPGERVEKRYGFRPDAAWLEHVQRSTAKLGNGCSASFVSASGLVMTNHHCAVRCIEDLSTKQSDLLTNGFLAKSAGEERRCPSLEVSQLESITDVTQRVVDATKGKDGAAFADARKATLSGIEKECATSEEQRCDVITLFHGGAYHLYKYRRYQDVRLVFAPEKTIAFFGGDPDNFSFPRYNLDATFFRVYDKDQPAKTPQHLGWSTLTPKAGDLTFVAGHPARTSRLKTLAQLAVERDVRLPDLLTRYSEMRGVFTEYGLAGGERERTSKQLVFGLENSIKAMRGRLAALGDPRFFAAKVAAEQELRAHIDQDPKLADARGAFEAVEKAQSLYREIYLAHAILERGAGGSSKLFDFARTLARAADELPKPNGERLRELTDARLSQLKNELFSAAPLYPELEAAKLAHGLLKMRELLGADHPVVKRVLGKEEPRALAARLVKTSKLADVKVRKALFEGGKAALDAAKDPLVELARQIDPEARALRKRYEEGVEAVEEKENMRIAKARFAVYGTNTYPDATGSLRLSFGSIQGYAEGGATVAPFTTLGGTFERATGKSPFDLPKSWIAAESRLDRSIPFNVITTNDIIGGNSGSPLIGKDGKVVGLIFDGNMHSLGGEFGYEGERNRAVSVTAVALVEALTKVYGAERVVSELAR
jgi:hypothetical protein